jgi:predicted GTPase
LSSDLGTTSDPVDEYVVWKNEHPLTLIDTAGIRKKTGAEVEELRSHHHQPFCDIHSQLKIHFLLIEKYSQF